MATWIGHLRVAGSAARRSPELDETAFALASAPDLASPTLTERV
ncbi:MAG: hypothetical protein U0703_27575 [Anaerolineae bacterium]